MHPGSTADPTAAAKPYTVGAQFHVLQHHLACLGLDERLTVRANPLYGAPGMWRIARLPDAPTPVLHVLLRPSVTSDDTRRAWHHLGEAGVPQQNVLVLGRDRAALSMTVEALHPGALVALLAPEVTPLTTEWPSEAAALLEAVPEAVAVSGCLVDHEDKVVSAGEVFGLDGVAGSPFRGLAPGDHSGYGMLICQRAVSAVDGRFFIARAGFLKELLADRRDLGLALLGAWLGAAARYKGRRILYSPHIVARLRADAPPRQPSADEVWRFLHAHWPLVLDDPTYSRFLGLTPADAYKVVPPAARAAVLNRLLAQLVGPSPAQEEWHVDPTRYPLRRPTVKPRRVRLDTSALGTLHYLDQPSLPPPPHGDLSTLHDFAGGPPERREGEFNSLPVV
jgi:hypothetical protein